MLGSKEKICDMTRYRDMIIPNVGLGDIIPFTVHCTGTMLGNDKIPLGPKVKQTQSITES